MDAPTATDLPALRDDPLPAVAALAARYRRANGPLIAVMNRIGGQIEAQMGLLPTPLRERVDGAVIAALEAAFGAARLGRLAPATGRRGARALAAMTGALGGAGGLATSLAELPVTVAVILHAIRGEADAAGFDPDDPVTRAQCLAVLAAGAPGTTDDGVNTAFVGARLVLSGQAVQRMLGLATPALSAALTRKLAAQAVPLLGAVTGAALNALYLGYYRELAAVRFGLLALATRHGAGPVFDAFARATATPAMTRG